jgi:hypothetical protein
VLRGRRDRFGSVALISGFALLSGLLVVSPQERVASGNLARPGDVDAAYLTSLSADAVPILLRALPELPPEPRDALTSELQRRWGSGTSSDWRSWTLADARARRLVREVPAAIGSADHVQVPRGPAASAPASLSLPGARP